MSWGLIIRKSSEFRAQSTGLSSTVRSDFSMTNWWAAGENWTGWCSARKCLSVYWGDKVFSVHFKQIFLSPQIWEEIQSGPSRGSRKPDRKYDSDSSSDKGNHISSAEDEKVNNKEYQSLTYIFQERFRFKTDFKEYLNKVSFYIDECSCFEASLTRKGVQ